MSEESRQTKRSRRSSHHARSKQQSSIRGPTQKSTRTQQHNHPTKSHINQKRSIHHHHRTWTNPRFLNRARVRSVPRSNCRVSNPGCRHHSSIPNKRGLRNEWGLNLKERKERKEKKKRKNLKHGEGLESTRREVSSTRSAYC